METLLDYELLIGQELYFIIQETACLKKGICRFINIKIYLDTNTSVVSEKQFLLEQEDGETFFVPERDTYLSFIDAAAALEQLIEA